MDYIYKHTHEASDSEVNEFLIDIDIALEQRYEVSNKQLFEMFSPYFIHTFQKGDLLFDRLVSAYTLLENEILKQHARSIVEKALVRCSLHPLGIRRTLFCIDLAHEIDIVLDNQKVFSNLMFRTKDPTDRPLWLWELISRVEDWNIKIDCKPEDWIIAIETIAPKGIESLIFYFHEQISVDYQSTWHIMKNKALERVKREKKNLRSVGQEPEFLASLIEGLPSQYVLSSDVLESIFRNIEDPSTQYHNIQLLNNVTKPNVIEYEY